MAPSTPKHAPPPRLNGVDAEFSWPPPDEELEQLFGPESPETSADSTPDPSRVMAAEDAGAHEPTTPTVAAAEPQCPPDRTRPGGWAAEITNLQALIEALTEPVEWRIPDAARR
jgi:hypothetical protein